MTFVPPGEKNPIGNAGKFELAKGATSAGEILRGLGTRLQARHMAQSQARAMIEAAKINAAAQMATREMELQSAAEAQQREHENSIKLARVNNNHEVRKARVDSQNALLEQTQSTIHTHGVLDRMITDFPDADLDFKTERGQSINIRRPREASSESSEGGSFL